MDLLLNMAELPSGLSATLTYNTDLYDGTTAERMLAQFQHLLEEVIRDASVRVSEVSLLTSDELAQLTVDWNDTAADFPTDKCLHEVISQQAMARPDAVAVVFGDSELAMASWKFGRIAWRTISKQRVLCVVTEWACIWTARSIWLWLCSL